MLSLFLKNKERNELKRVSGLLCPFSGWDRQIKEKMPVALSFGGDSSRDKQVPPLFVAWFSLDLTECSWSTVL